MYNNARFYIKRYININ